MPYLAMIKDPDDDSDHCKIESPVPCATVSISGKFYKKIFP